MVVVAREIAFYRRRLPLPLFITLFTELPRRALLGNSSPASCIKTLEPRSYSEDHND